MVAAGALVLENTVIPDGMVAMGVPAKVREAASPALVEANRKMPKGMWRKPPPMRRRISKS